MFYEPDLQCGGSVRSTHIPLAVISPWRNHSWGGAGRWSPPACPGGNKKRSHKWAAGICLIFSSSVWFHPPLTPQLRTKGKGFLFILRYKEGWNDKSELHAGSSHWIQRFFQIISSFYSRLAKKKKKKKVFLSCTPFPPKYVRSSTSKTQQTQTWQFTLFLYSSSSVVFCFFFYSYNSISLTQSALNILHLYHLKGWKTCLNVIRLVFHTRKTSSSNTFMW